MDVSGVRKNWFNFCIGKNKIVVLFIMSVLRRYAINDANVTQLTPKFEGVLPNTDISGCSYYSLTIPNAQYGNNVYQVDLSGFDLSGNLLNVDGLFYPFFPNGTSQTPIAILCFKVNIPIQASVYPGVEFTISFKNIPFNRLGIPLLTIGLLPNSEMGIPLPYILSPPYPQLLGSSIYPTITMKSDGDNFVVSSSGPAGWLGLPALSVILSAYNNIV